MLIRESILRKLIQEALLLEAVYKQKDLMALSPELTNIISQQFELIDSTASLTNEKSPGRFFIDALYECMRELLGEFDPVTDADKAQFLEKIEMMCVQLVILFQQKEVTSSTVQTGATFKDYIYSFMLKPKEFLVKDYEDRPITDILTKLKYVYNNVMSRSKISGPERIMKFKEIIKRKDTYYPFGKDLVEGKYLVVCPLNMMSSIFWARTNAAAESIVLPEQKDISWCTARFTGGNMFNTYFIGGGTNLFYFLPANDDAGREKFCVGITKMKDEKKENAAPYLVMGGTTTVNFNNKAVLERQQIVNEKVLQEISDKLKVSMSVLDRLIDVMENKEPMDSYKYTSLLDLEQFVAATNLDTIDPFDIKQQVEQTLKMYVNPEYLKRGYKPDPKIINYCIKTWSTWIYGGMKELNENAISNLFKLVPGLSADKKFVMGFITATPQCYKYLDPSLQDDESLVNYLIEMNCNTLIKFSDKIRNNRELMLKDYERNPYKNLNFLGQDLLNDMSFVKELIKRAPDIFYEDKILKLFANNREFILERIKNKPSDFDFSSINSIYKNDFEIALEAVTGDINTVISIGKELRNNPDFCTELYLRKPEYFAKLNFTADEFSLMKYQQKNNIIVLRDIYRNINFKKVKANTKQNQTGHEKNAGFFNNITNKVKSFFKGNNTNEGRIIRISENELRKIIRREILK